MTIPLRGTFCAHHSREVTQSLTPHAQTWITRGANFVVAVTRAEAGARLERTGDLDESMILFVSASGHVDTTNGAVQAGPDSLVITPPGDHVVTATTPGLIVRVFTNRATDLTAQAVNAALYDRHPVGTAPLIDWPPPHGGFQLRHHRLDEHLQQGSKTRVFRTSCLMINLLAPRLQPRDVSALSPHRHDDFEQASVVLSGTFLHHLRHPWGPDMTLWRPDETLEAGSPSVTIIPPGVIHTSRNIGSDTGRLLDVFGPPRADFARRPEMVCNAADYPLPETIA